MKRVVLWLALICGLATLPAQAAPAAKLGLRPSYGGAVLQGRIGNIGTDALVGVWSGVGFSRLMKCAPRCTVVSSIPMSGTLVVSNTTPYRVALGGKFSPGQKVPVTLRFKRQGVLTVMAQVSKP